MWTQISRRARAFLSLLKTGWSEYERDYARYYAAAMVYYALVSLVPLILLMLAVMGLALRHSGLAAAAEQQVLAAVQATFGAQLRQTIEHLFAVLEQESVVATFAGIGGLLLTASVLFKQLRLSFRAIWKYEPPIVAGSVRGVVTATFFEQVISFLMVLAGGLLLLLALALIAAVQWFGGFFANLPLLGPASRWLFGLTGPLLVVILTFALLYRFLPPVPPRWREVWPPAAFAGVAWLVASELLALYTRVFGGNPSATGALGTLLAIMLWMFLVSQVLFFGAEMCKVASVGPKAHRPASDARVSSGRTPPARRAGPSPSSGRAAGGLGSSAG
jgi:membrane protein